MADKHESPHFANLYDLVLKYADVLTVAGNAWSSCDVCRHGRGSRP